MFDQKILNENSVNNDHVEYKHEQQLHDLNAEYIETHIRAQNLIA